MRVDRRIVLFAVLSLLCFALTPFADDQYRKVPVIVGAAYLVLAVLFFFDWWSRQRSARQPSD